ncbi:hypothetical protein L915_02696 [Phytophthora nicotianae]|uniref:Uncharacterized protein n=1 Tax=Phytophthora nicotianae TaxID=4792 RepID=W2HG26_PHYNI|nr:hypothetical protein L915_02696 [Phytophthora nicotianae]
MKTQMRREEAVGVGVVVVGVVVGVVVVWVEADEGEREGRLTMEEGETQALDYGTRTASRVTRNAIALRTGGSGSLTRTSRSAPSETKKKSGVVFEVNRQMNRESRYNSSIHRCTGAIAYYFDHSWEIKSKESPDSLLGLTEILPKCFLMHNTECVLHKWITPL